MKSFLLRMIFTLLENAGIGILALLPLLLIIFMYTIIGSPVDHLASPITFFLFGREIPFMGFAIILIGLAALGGIIRTKIGWNIIEPFFRRIPMAAPILQGIRNGMVKRLIQSCRKDAPNIILAPYFRKGAYWPFIILRIFPTSDPECPIISGVYIDLPLFFKGGTLPPKDIIYAGISFDEAVLFATTCGTGFTNFKRPPRKVLLGNFLKEPRVAQFLQDNIEATIRNTIDAAPTQNP